MSSPDETLTIPAMLRRSAERFAGHTAIEDGDVNLGFTELARAAERAARAFVARGVQPGDRVAVWAPNVYEWVVAALGAQCAGGVLVPLSTRLKGEEAGYILRRSRARLLCTVGSFLDTDYVGLLLDALGGVGDGRPVEGLETLEGIVLLRDADVGRGLEAGGEAWSTFLEAGEEIAAELVHERVEAIGPDDMCDILFTSGTTGQPKGVMTSHAQNLRCFESWSELVGLREGDRYLIVNPFFHSFGYKAGWLACVMRGATILPQAVFDVPEILARIPGTDRISVLPGPPTVYQSILARPGSRELRPLQPAARRHRGRGDPGRADPRMRDELGFDTVVTAYGLTESVRPGDHLPTAGRRSRDHRNDLGSCAIPGIEVRCVDPRRPGQWRPGSRERSWSVATT